jgi:PAB-dependent poly(A)-specific ribonuclease subunit 3
MSEKIHEQLWRRAQHVWATCALDDPRVQQFPRVLDDYHSLVPLESYEASRQPSKAYGYMSEVFKATGQADGLPYCIRRLHSAHPTSRLPLEFAHAAAELWQSAVPVHANIVTLRKVFSSKVVGGVNDLYYVYDFHPTAKTLQELHFEQSDAADESGNSSAPPAIAEDVLWSYIVQLAAALFAVHSAGLAAQVVRPCKILATGANRVRLNGVGVLDALIHADRQKRVPRLQYEDLVSLGKLALSLACNSLHAMRSLPASLELVARRYSPDVKNFIVYLLSKPIGRKYPTAGDVLGLLAPRLAIDLNGERARADRLEAELAKAAENARLFRLVTKLGFINERPEFEMDPSWAETGDRYLLKLFRDYVFHQVHQDGSPSLDFAHVVETLNKFDVGANEKIVLASRDEQSMLVASYADLRRCADQAFQELLDASSSSSPPPPSSAMAPQSTISIGAPITAQHVANAAHFVPPPVGAGGLAAAPRRTSSPSLAVYSNAPVWTPPQ